MAVSHSSAILRSTSAFFRAVSSASHPPIAMMKSVAATATEPRIASAGWRRHQREARPKRPTGRALIGLPASQ